MRWHSRPFANKFIVFSDYSIMSRHNSISLHNRSKKSHNFSFLFCKLFEELWEIFFCTNFLAHDTFLAKASAGRRLYMLCLAIFSGEYFTENVRWSTHTLEGNRTHITISHLSPVCMRERGRNCYGNKKWKYFSPFSQYGPSYSMLRHSHIGPESVEIQMPPCWHGSCLSQASVKLLRKPCELVSHHIVDEQQASVAMWISENGWKD